MLAHSNRIANLVNSVVKGEDKTLSRESSPSQRKKKTFLEPDEIVRKEVRQAVGRIDPLIKPPIEETLRTVKYKHKTKIDVMDDVVGSIDKRVQALQDKRFNGVVDPRHVPTKNPLLELDPEIEYEDLLEEGEARRAYEAKDIDKIELLLLKSKVKLEKYDDEYSSTRSGFGLSNIEGLGKSTVSFNLGGSKYSQGFGQSYISNYGNTASPPIHSSYANPHWQSATNGQFGTQGSHSYVERSRSPRSDSAKRRETNPYAYSSSGYYRSETPHQSAPAENIIVYKKNKTSAFTDSFHVEYHPTGGSLATYKIRNKSPHNPKVVSETYFAGRNKGRPMSPNRRFNPDSPHLPERSSSPQLRSSRYTSSHVEAEAASPYIAATPYEKVKPNSSYLNSSGASPYLTASTANSQNISMSPSRRF